MHKLSLKWSRQAVMRRLSVLLIAAVAISPAPAAATPEEAGPSIATAEAASAAFDRLHALEGTWQVADREDHPLRIRFYRTAGGKTLVEAWEANGRSHSLTIYHRDGNTLLATHYCPQGNQPRMELAAGENGQIRFTFRDVTDLDAQKEQHQHELSFNLNAGDRIVRSEQYMDGEGNLHPSTLMLSRVANE